MSDNNGNATQWERVKAFFRKVWSLINRFLRFMASQAWEVIGEHPRQAFYAVVALGVIGLGFVLQAFGELERVLSTILLLGGVAGVFILGFLMIIGKHPWRKKKKK